MLNTAAIFAMSLVTPILLKYVTELGTEAALFEIIIKLILEAMNTENALTTNCEWRSFNVAVSRV